MRNLNTNNQFCTNIKNKIQVITWCEKTMNPKIRRCKRTISESWDSYFLHQVNGVVETFGCNMITVLSSRRVFSCDQAALWMVFSVRLSVYPSVCLYVCHTFLTMFPSLYHHEIFRSYYQWQKWCPCKRSRSEVKGQGHSGHNPT